MKKTTWYKLTEDKQVVPATIEEVGAIYSEDNRIVSQKRIDSVWISTVFLALDHDYFGEGPPVVFETMAFRHGWDEVVQQRYCTYKEAQAGHIDIVKHFIKERRVEKRVFKIVNYLFYLLAAIVFIIAKCLILVYANHF